MKTSGRPANEDSLRGGIARVQVATDKDEGATMALVRVEAELDRARASERVQRAENLALLAVLAPFAEFARAFDAKPLRGIADEVYGIHSGTKWEAALRLSDCRAALKALEGE